MDGPQVDIDGIDCKILGALQSNARISFAELGRTIGLSTPATMERVRKLEDAGVILGYHALVNPAKIGCPLEAFIKVTVAGDKLTRFAQNVKSIDEVLECYRITGVESFLVLVAVRDTAHLQILIDRLMPYTATNTSIVLDIPIRWNPLIPSVHRAKS